MIYCFCQRKNLVRWKLFVVVKVKITMSDEFHFENNQKGQSTLIRGVHRYNKNRSNKTGSTLWRCVNRSECIASLTLDITRKIITRETEHTCNIYDFKNIIRHHVGCLKKAVCKDFRPIQQIFEEHLIILRRKVPNPDHDMLPSFHSIKDTLYRARKKFLNTNRLLHTSLATVTVPETLANKILVCEDGDVDKILIFATSTGRKFIKRPGLYYGDGTFKSAPPPFYQFYVLHMDINSNEKCTNIIPIIYALLPNKAQNTYVRLFSILKEKLKIQIRQFKCDYEIAQMNAVRLAFPNADISGCYHHYNDAIWKICEKVGLLGTKEGRNVAKITALIPLIPANQIAAAWCHALEQARQDTPGFNQFRCYFEKQ
jgi:hypothetical protein